MKHFLVVFACCLILQAPTHAVELSLNGTSPLGVGFPALADGGGTPVGKSLEADAGSMARTHASDEPRVGLSPDGPGTVGLPTFDGPSGASGSTTAPGWLKAGGSPSLTLDEPGRTHAAGTLDAVLPVAANAGVSDSMMYAVLALLAVAMAWACAGFVSRKQGAPVPAAWGESRRAPRQVRVRMMPLNVGR